MPYKDPARKRAWDATHRPERRRRALDATAWADEQIRVLDAISPRKESRRELRKTFRVLYLSDGYRSRERAATDPPASMDPTDPG